MNSTEIKTANILLKRGVELSIPASFFRRLRGQKTEKIILKTPSVECQIAIAKAYLETGIELGEDIGVEGVFQLLAQYGVAVSEILALAMSNATRIESRAIRRLAKRLRQALTMEELSYLFSLIVAFSGVEDFMNTIRLIQATRITQPMNLSQREKMS